MLYQNLLLALALATRSSSLPRPRADVTGSHLTPEIDALIKDTMRSWGIPGLGVAVVQLMPDGSWSREVKGYGVANLKGTPVDGDTLFEIGSDSKLFTAVATGLLAANESISPRFSLSTKAKDVIPGWKLMDPVASELTNMQDLLSHRMGIPRNDYLTDKHTSALDAVSLLRYLRPSEEFRDKWQYNNLGYLTLTTLPSILAGTPFTDYTLGMNSATYSYAEALATGKLAQGFTRVNLSEDTLFSGDNNRAQGVNFLEGMRSDGEVSGSGGLIMSINDAATWMQALLLSGANPATNVSAIPPAVVDGAATGSSIMFPTALYPEQSAQVYGNGLFRYSYRGVEIIEHDGDIPGFCALHTRVPTLGLGIAFSSNIDVFGHSIDNIVRYRIIDNALGLPPIDWDTRRRHELVDSLTSAPVALSRPVNASTPVPFATIAQLYHNPAYGYVELCLVPSVSTIRTSACIDLEKTIPYVLPGVVDSSIPTFVAAVNKVWTHLVLTQFDGALYNASFIASSAPVDSEGPNSVQVFTTATAEFALGFFENQVTGFGLYGGIWGSNTTVEPTGPSVADHSEVFFDANH